jgi:PTH1 family peptidyl-tRNA hydrolase
MRVVVGLGNPGSRYAETRHNVGFMVVDALAESVNAGKFRSRFQADIAELREDEDTILLVKPQTYMNLSGKAVREVVDYYQVPLENVIVVCDDINLSLGKLRFRARGSHGGHNGLRDIQNHLATTEYSRLRLGVGAPEEDDTIDHVLGRFRPAELPLVEEAVAKAVQGIALWWKEGIEECMNEFNG